MRQLSAEDTRGFVNEYLKTFGTLRAAAKAMTDHGFRAPSGGKVFHSHLQRVLSGVDSQFLKLEESDKVPPSAAVEVVEEPSPGERISGMEPVEESEEEAMEPVEEAEALEPEEIEEEEEPPKIPSGCFRDYQIRPQARVSAVFNRRGAVEFEEKDFYGLPRMRRPAPIEKAVPRRGWRSGIKSLQ